jgi:hypothetical protein
LTIAGVLFIIFGLLTGILIHTRSRRLRLARGRGFSGLEVLFLLSQWAGAFIAVILGILVLVVSLW